LGDRHGDRELELFDAAVKDSVAVWPYGAPTFRRAG
jgi:hypothetical protein